MKFGVSLTDPDTVLRKAFFITFFYVIYYNLVFFFFKTVIFRDFFYLAYIMILYVAGSIDTLVRPLEKQEREAGNDAFFSSFYS